MELVAVGEKGEICVTGPQVMQGYWMQDAESATALEGGRLHTGDVGHMDEDGYVFISDRIKDLIITGGFNVYPRMVEESIMRHPVVEDVAVCGVPSNHHGEIVKAFVVLRPGEKIKAAELRAFLKDRLASFEMPRRIQFTKAIPKTMLGKPLRRELVAREWRKAGLERAAELAVAEGETS
jgi:long-chain acyl-CoA synthetase